MQPSEPSPEDSWLSLDIALKRAPAQVRAGICDVLNIIQDAGVAWDFLTEESVFLDPPQRPLDALKAGKIAEVGAAAESHGSAFT